MARKKSISSDDLFFSTRQTLIGFTRGNYLSSRNYRNRWRGCLEKKTCAEIFFFMGQAKSRVRENVTARFVITLQPRESLRHVSFETLAFNASIEGPSKCDRGNSRGARFLSITRLFPAWKTDAGGTVVINAVNYAI